MLKHQIYTVQYDVLNDGTWTYDTYLAVYVGHPFVSYDDNIIHQCEFAREQNTGPPFFSQRLTCRLQNRVHVHICR